MQTSILKTGELGVNWDITTELRVNWDFTTELGVIWDITEPIPEPIGTAHFLLQVN